jgi:hypothetical protein
MVGFLSVLDQTLKENERLQGIIRLLLEHVDPDDAHFDDKRAELVEEFQSELNARR